MFLFWLLLASSIAYILLRDEDSFFTQKNHDKHDFFSEEDFEEENYH